MDEGLRAGLGWTVRLLAVHSRAAGDASGVLAADAAVMINAWAVRDATCPFETSGDRQLPGLTAAWAVRDTARP